MTPRPRRHPVVEPLAQAISDIARSVSSPVPSEQPTDAFDYHAEEVENDLGVMARSDSFDEFADACDDLNEASEAEE